jgi:3-phosphoshikimate 1-carboxyvinyltransferase
MRDLSESARGRALTRRPELEPTIAIDVRGPISWSPPVPPSKSHAIRTLVAASRAPGVTTIRLGFGAGEDVEVVANALRALGVGVVDIPAVRGTSIGVHGTVRFPAGGVTLDMRDCGTGARLLTAMAALARGPVRVDGSARLRERPMEPLLVALRALGVAVTEEGEPGRLPVTVSGEPTPGGAAVEVEGSLSSQFVSALLLLGPAEGLDLRVTGRPVSRPYVDLTLDVLATFGVEVERTDGGYRVPRMPLLATEVEIEADASSAAFWLGAVAVAGGEVEIPGIPATSRQADRAIVDHLAALGCEAETTPDGLRARGRATRGGELDLRDSPDLLPVLAAVAGTIPETTRLVGAPHLVHKESDRIAAMADVLTTLGAKAEPLPDGLVVTGGGLRGGTIDPRGDHRIAMAAFQEIILGSRPTGRSGAA